MISEKAFSRSFSGFWAELLPLLTPSFVHMFNETYQVELLGTQGFLAEPVEKTSDTSDSALVAEAAFYLAKLATQLGSSATLACSDTTIMASAVSLAAERVSAYEGGTQQPSELTDAEHKEVTLLAKNYDNLLLMHPTRTSVNFNPQIRGAGFIASCEADIAIDTTIYEVKTTTRNIAGKDIRQLIVYLALQAATGERRWFTASFFNPRKALVHRFIVDELIYEMSGGRSAAEIFQDIISFASMREVQMDTVF